MDGRIRSIDMLRGLSIIGMVLCSAYCWDSGLPAFMFHCQEPPPTHAFDPSVRGITWVDLVFPFFLFSLGAAFPVALGRKLDRGVGKGTVALGLVRRWITLVLFSLILGNNGAIFATGSPEIVKGILVVAVWLALFASLVRTGHRWLNLCGYAMLLGLFLLETLAFGADFSLFCTDIIIMIMAWMALLGGLIWLLTRGKPGLRALVFAFVLAIKALASYTPVLSGIGVPPCIGWMFGWNYCQYLLIVIPASFVGELLLRPGGNQSRVLPSIVALSAVLVQLWGLFTRHLIADFGITVALALAYALLTGKSASKSGIIALTGFAFLIAGIAFDPLDGGIAKDPCNISYLLCTFGMAGLVLSALLNAEDRGFKGGIMSLCGQNPMIAYTIVAGFISPALYACGLLGLLDSLGSGSVFWGLVRGLTVTAAMCLCTAFFTKRKIFWRS